MNEYGIIVAGILGLCWGSFLNAIAFRIVNHRSLWTKRSVCPACNTTIAWFDLIPLVSWVMLGARCRRCKHPISIIYPFIELATSIVAISIYLTFFIPSPDCTFPPELYEFFKQTGVISWCAHSLGTTIAYSIFFSGLLAGTATDFYAMVIPQIFSVYLIPCGLLAAYLNVIPITLAQSFMGAIISYGLLWVTGWMFKYLKGIEGIGIGDMEFLALIGSFTGVHGAWITLMIGSIIGIIVGGGYLMHTKQKFSVRIPFGPFLAIGAYIYVFFGHLFAHGEQPVLKFNLFPTEDRGVSI